MACGSRGVDRGRAAVVAECKNVTINKPSETPVIASTPIVARDGTDLVSQAEGIVQRILWDDGFGGEIVIEVFGDGRCRVNGKFTETPEQTSAGLAAARKEVENRK